VSRAARFIPILALAASLTIAAWILFGPTYSYCSSSLSSTGTPGPTVCGTSNLVTVQAGNLFPAPLLFIAAWALAPVLGIIGTRSGSRGYALALTGAALLLDATSIISFGGGFLFALTVAPLLLITLVLIGIRRSDATDG
jgi:hypothetical protein